MSREQYYNAYGQRIRNPKAYASTGAPMYKNFTTKRGKKINNPKSYVKSGGSLYANNINKEKSIYIVECDDNKKYIGETSNFDKRMKQHFTGNGSKVTQKFKPKKATELERIPGYFAKEIEQEYTDKFIRKYGYDNVRGGKYTNSKTLKKSYYQVISSSDDYD